MSTPKKKEKGETGWESVRFWAGTKQILDIKSSILGSVSAQKEELQLRLHVFFDELALRVAREIDGLRLEGPLPEGPDMHMEKYEVGAPGEVANYYQSTFRAVYSEFKAVIADHLRSYPEGIAEKAFNSGVLLEFARFLCRYLQGRLTARLSEALGGEFATFQRDFRHETVFDDAPLHDIVIDSEAALGQLCRRSRIEMDHQARLLHGKSLPDIIELVEAETKGKKNGASGVRFGSSKALRRYCDKHHIELLNPDPKRRGNFTVDIEKLISAVETDPPTA